MTIGIIIVASIAAIMTIIYLGLLLVDIYSYKIDINYKTFRFIKMIVIVCIIMLVMLGVIWYARKFW